MLMAADMSTILMPLASETVTVQVNLAENTDMNSDGRVDVADLGILGSQFNVHAGSSGPADVNKDQVVDVTDLGMLGANWTARPLSRSPRSEEHTSELQSLVNLVCRPLLEKKKKERHNNSNDAF